MRWFRFAVLVIAAVIIQAGLANFKYRPDLLLILMVFFSVYAGRKQAIVTSFITGFACDLIGFAIGPATLSFGLLGTLLSNLTRLVTIRKMTYQAFTIFFMGILSGFSIYLLNSIKGQTSNPNIYRLIFWTSLLSAIVGGFLFLPAAWWMGIDTAGRKRT
jgi:rod shape-determining protein MreD